jgi:nanoRNase/pAp phosphatase (c-di-AMP/oligoRNAs hydrolase)
VNQREFLLQFQQRNTLCQLLELPIKSISDPQSLKDLSQCLDTQNITESGGMTVVQGANREVCFL